MRNEYIVAFLIFFTLTAIFFHKIFLGFVPVPFDIIAGGYFPWVEYSWDYPVRVPVKNPALSDVISTAYPWKYIAISAFKNGELPLWNPYYFSGTPLLANWQSAAIYPLNIVFLLNDFLTAWTILITLQPLLASFFMYLFLRVLKRSKIAAIFGSLVFGFSGYLMVFLEYGYLQAAVWLPLLFYLLEKAILTKKNIYFASTPLVIFLIITAANFQAVVYSICLSLAYVLFRSFNVRNLKYLYLILLFFILGIGLSAVQLLPTFEAFNLSIRSEDANITHLNYGLIPLDNLIRILAPDFFGNPATFNFTGFLYHETSAYFGVIPLMLVILAIIYSRGITLFFTVTFIASLILSLDTFLGRIPYILQLPLISTSYASRVLLVSTFSAAVLSAFGFESLHNRIINKISISLLLILIFTTVFKLLAGFDNLIWLRNSVLSVLILIVFLIVFNFKQFLNNRLFYLFIFLITIFDLFRFGLKYNSFSLPSLNYPQTPVISFLQSNSQYNRIEREKTENLPANTWLMYKLYSPSGYDPLLLNSYARFYNIYNKVDAQGGVSRYRELDNFNPQILNLLGVKYFLVAKRREDGAISTSGDIRKQFQTPQFSKVFEDGANIVLENRQSFPKVKLYYQNISESDLITSLNKLKELDLQKTIILNSKITDDLREGKSDWAEISEYNLNEVSIKTKVEHGAILLLSDVNYPGWNVYLNEKKTEVLTTDGVFRGVHLPAGEWEVKFKFEPQSFRTGLILSSLFLVLTIMIAFVSQRFKLNI